MEVFISLDAAIRRCVPMDFDSKMAVSEAELRRIPAADVRPVVKARDICNEHESHCEFKCSNCGAWIGEVAYGTMDGGNFNFCPNCGAMMEEA